MRKIPYPKKPYKQNDLFTGGENIHLNACVGTNGGPYELDDYAIGYFSAAIRLADSLKNDHTFVDVVIYPLVYIYRHGVELYLKHFASILPHLYNEASIVESTHKIIDNWRIVRCLLERTTDFDSDNTLIPVVDRILNDLVEIDPNGEAFRFPHARSGNRFLQDTSLINVEVLATTMNTLFDAFEYWDFKANVLWDIKCEYEDDIV